MLAAPTPWYAPAVPHEPPSESPAPARIRDRATWLISRSHARSYRLLSDGFAAEGSGLRGYHYRVLAALEEWGPIGQAELGRRTGLDRSDVVTILGDLERLRLTERSVDPVNRRRNIVAITPGGEARLRILDEVVDQVQERVLEPLSANERRQLMRLLRKLADSD